MAQRVPSSAQMVSSLLLRRSKNLALSKIQTDDDCSRSDCFGYMLSMTQAHSRLRLNKPRVASRAVSLMLGASCFSRRQYEWHAFSLTCTSAGVCYLSNGQLHTSGFPFSLPALVHLASPPEDLRSFPSPFFSNSARGSLLRLLHHRSPSVQRLPLNRDVG